MASKTELVVKSVKLDERAMRTSKALQKKLGLAFSNIVRLALTRLAEAEGINKAA